MALGAALWASVPMAAWAGMLGWAAGHLGVLRPLLRRLGWEKSSAKLMPLAWRKRHEEALAAVAAGLGRQQQALTHTLQALEAEGAVLAAIRAHTRDLAPAALGGQEQLEQGAAGHKAMNGHLAALRLTLTQTGTSLEEMVFSSNEVVSSIQNLSRAAEETAGSINEMDESMAQVVSQANSSSTLSEKVSQDAEAGVTAIKQTVQGIDKIKINNRLAAEVIDRLHQCINEVSTVLGVIDDVAEQTNLLALNAAIIAAQAGDHGRGFAVVADEIKALAERTGTSTKEISDIILRIQEHSRRVTDVVTSGVQDVEAGMLLGQHAEDALQHVVSSAQRSMVMMRGIAQATVEHAKGAKKINSAMGQVTETMAQIYYATSEQTRGSEVVMGNITSMQNTLAQAQEILASDAALHQALRGLCDTVAQQGEALGPLLDQGTQHLGTVDTGPTLAAHADALQAHVAELSQLTATRL